MSGGYQWKEDKKSHFERNGKLKPRFRGVRDGFGGSRKFGQSTSAGSLLSGTIDSSGSVYNLRAFKKRMKRSTHSRTTVELNEREETLFNHLIVCKPNVLKKKYRTDAVFSEACAIAGVELFDIIPKALKDFRPQFNQGPSHPSKQTQERLLSFAEIRRRNQLKRVILEFTKLQKPQGETNEEDERKHHQHHHFGKLPGEKWLEKKMKREKAKAETRALREAQRLERVRRRQHELEKEANYLRESTLAKQRIVQGRLRRRDTIRFHNAEAKRASWHARVELMGLSRIVAAQSKTVRVGKIPQTGSGNAVCGNVVALAKSKKSERNALREKVKAARMLKEKEMTKVAAHARLRKEANSEMQRLIARQDREVQFAKNRQKQMELQERRKEHAKKEKERIDRLRKKVNAKEKRMEERKQRREHLRQELLRCDHFNISGKCEKCDDYYKGSTSNKKPDGDGRPSRTNTNGSEVGALSVHDCYCTSGSCVKGKYADPNENYACKVCPKGSYKDDNNSDTRCKTCPSNSTTESTGKIAKQHCACVKGWYNDGTSCTACPVGSYKDKVSNAATCTACSQTRNASTTGGLGKTQLSDCLCRKGYRKNGDTSSHCTTCENGKYQSKLHYDKVCTDCPDSNMISMIASTVVTACKCDVGYEKSGTKCILCDIGKYKDEKENNACKTCDSNETTTKKGQASCVCKKGFEKISTCKECAKGKFKSASSNATCTACNSGYYSSKKGASRCKGCAAGKEMNSDASGCVQCGDGSASALADDCTQCAGGKISNPTKTDCTNCAPNTFSKAGSGSCTACGTGSTSASGASSCIKMQVQNCTAGKFLDSGQCSNCAAGKSSLNGATQCFSCPAGKYNETSGSSCSNCSAGTSSSQGATSSTNCTACSSGSYATAGALCTACAAGKEVNQAKSGCVNCSSGSFSGNAGSSSCTACGTGSTSASGASSCIKMQVQNCTAGKFLDSGQCSNCAAGKSSLNGATQCFSCPAGKYNETSGSSCSNCSAGTSSSQGATSSTNCTACSSGSYATAGALCTACAAGKEVNQAKSGCVNCSSGSFSGNAGDSCTACGTGSTSASGASSCTQMQIQVCNSSTFLQNGNCSNCAAGKSSLNGASQCFSCPAGKYNQTSGSSCSNCSAGTSSSTGATSCSAVQAGAYTTGSGTTAIACEEGHISVSGTHCVSCEVGKYFSSNTCIDCNAGSSSLAASVSCTACGVGFFSSISGSRCIQCPLGSSSSSIGSTDVNQCFSCPIGKKDKSGRCVDCESGQYQNLAGETKCNHCGDGMGTYTTTSTVTGSVSQSNCTQCPSGKYSISEIIDGALFDRTGCQDCPLGQYQDENAKSKCKICPNGSGSNVSGSTSITSCIACGEGYYSSDMGCIACSAGTYNNERGQTICKVCPGQNQTTKVAIATKDTDCIELEYKHAVLVSVGRRLACEDIPRAFLLSEKGCGGFRRLLKEDKKMRHLTQRRRGLSENVMKCGDIGEDQWRRQVIAAFEKKTEIEKVLFTGCTNGTHQVRVTMKVSNDFDKTKAKNSLLRIYNESKEIKKLVAQGSINILGVNKRKLCSASDFACTDGASIDESAACATSTCDAKLDFGDESSRCCMMKISAEGNNGSTLRPGVSFLLQLLMVSTLLC
eukprot:g1240.t1